MPLSEHEQRVLEQMEKALYAEDPRLATQLKRTATTGGPARLDRRRLAVGVLVALAGLALVVVGVMSQQIWVGAIGFLAMVLGGAWAATPTSRPHLGVVGTSGAVSRPGGKARKSRKGGGSFMDRMEQQWDKRKEQGPF